MSTSESDPAISVLRHLGLGLLTLLVVSLVVFAVGELRPPDFAEDALATGVEEEAVGSALAAEAPESLRYLGWLGGILTGDFGVSFADGRPVADRLGPALANTILLALIAAVIALPVALAAGVAAALRRRSLFDRSSRAAAIALIASPEFLLAFVVILILAPATPMFPSTEQAENASALLPALALAFAAAARLARTARGAIAEILEKPYIEQARLTGVGPRRLLLRHAAPNALGPFADAAARDLALLLAGVVVVEALFGYPGLGRLLVEAAMVRDAPTAQACALVFAALCVGLRLAADVAQILANPRMRRASRPKEART